MYMYIVYIHLHIQTDAHVHVHIYSIIIPQVWFFWVIIETILGGFVSFS